MSRRSRALPFDIADPGLAAAGAARLAATERGMPVLGALRARFATERPLAQRRVAVGMHVTPETAVLARTLQAAGAEVWLAASNPLATQDDVAAALAADGVAVHARRGAAASEYRGQLRAVLAADPDLLLDDGCDLVSLLHDEPELAPGVRAGCEETATGVLRLRRLAAEGRLRLPMLAVNDTPVQLLVANQHGTGQSVWDAVLRCSGVLLAGATVAVVGYGWCGRGVAARARGLGAQVVVSEVAARPALAAMLAGHRVLPLTAALPLADVVITCTGSREVVGGAQVALLRDGALLANAGHFDLEIDVPAIETAAVSVRRAVRPQLDEFLLGDGRWVRVCAGGRVVNLAAAEGHPAAVMDVSFAVQALALVWLAGATLPPGVHPVPAEIDEQVATAWLTARGVQLDSLTPAQLRYRDGRQP